MTPTREELIAILFSDPASEAFVGDAHDILASERDDADALGALKEVLAVVASDEEEAVWSAELELDDEDTVEEPVAVVSERNVAVWLREHCPCDGCLFYGTCSEIPPVLNPVHVGAAT